MNQIKISLICLLFISGCTAFNGQDLKNPKDDTVISSIWYLDFGTPTSIGTINRSPCLDTIPKTHERLLREINISFPTVRLSFLKTSNDTIYVKVINSPALTESMGTTGADSFLAIATFTLTEIKNIEYVYFEIEDGSHAQKGVQTRESFNGIFNVGK